MSNYVIETKEIVKTYSSFLALNQVNMHVRKGSIYGLVGDNGAGKSTLLKLLAGQSFATKGEIYLFDEHNDKQLNLARMKMGFMIEQPGFFPNMTVLQTLEYYCIQKGIPDRKGITNVLEITGIAEKQKSKCKTLSQGQKQRLGLAIAMLGEPQVLILDEPINGLDPSGIIEFRNLLHRLNEENNITILLSSHILAELQQIATVYGFLSKGRLIEEIEAEELGKKCSDAVELILSDVEVYTALLDKKYPSLNYKVIADHVLHIYNPIHKVEFYSRLATENKIDIIGMNKMRSSLEDYYMDLKKGGSAL